MFTAALLTIARHRNNLNVYNRGVNKEDVIKGILLVYYSNIKRNRIVLFA